MNRRDAMLAVGGTVAAFSMAAVAETAKKAAPAAKEAPKADKAAVNQALLEALQHCVAAGEVCLNHCVKSLSAGENMMVECCGTVRQMLPLCKAMVELTLQNSAHLKALAAICAKACKDCEAACKKHADMHAECKACMESCGKCAAECEKAAA